MLQIATKKIDPIRLYISDVILQTLSSLLSEEQFKEISNSLRDSLIQPPQWEMGHWALGCFTLAKTMRKSPPQIASLLAENIKNDGSFSKVEHLGPYLNFTLKSDFLAQHWLNKIMDDSWEESFIHDLLPKIMVEFSQPNTHKEMHVGHMRNACFGDALVRLLRSIGAEVITSTFPGDVGTHVAKCLWYFKYHCSESIPESNRGEWLGRIYSLGHLKLEQELGTPQELVNRAQLTEILKQIEVQSGEFYELWKQTREWSKELMESIYSWVEIQFDKWYWESEVDAPSRKYVQSLYQNKQLVLSEGAIGMDLSSEGLGFCLLMKTDGTGLYATKDLELARQKFQDFHIQKSLYVVDVRQTLHFQQIFKVLEKLGFKEAQQCEHLQYNFVELPDGAMSSRKGNIIPLTLLIQKMESLVIDQYLIRYEGQWSDAEIQATARQVAQGAIKYGMLKIDPNKKIVFDMQEWLKLEGDSGPFIQYSVARINSLCDKFDFNAKISSVSSKDWERLSHSSERKLIHQILDFQRILIESATHYRPSLMCRYIFELAQGFNLFYHECSVGQASSKELKEARLTLSFVVGKVLQKGLSLLGIPSPKRM